MRNFITEECRTRLALAVQNTGSGTQGYLLPTAGSSLIVLRCPVTMGNAADLVLSVKYADDTTGTSATAIGYNIPIYKNGVRQTDAKTFTVDESTGNFIVDFIIDPKFVPDGKYIGVSYATSHSSTFMCCEMIEYVGYKPTAS
jgi:hypothetical protein